MLEGGSEFGGDDDFADDSNSLYDEEFSKGGAGSFEMSGGGPNIGNSKNTSLRNTPKGASGVNIVLAPKQQKRRTMGQILKS